MRADAITLQLGPQAMDDWVELLARAPTDGAAFVMVKREDVSALIHDARAARQLHDLVNTPELVDFGQAVLREAAHQVLRWGPDDRSEKTPYAWFWLISHLATRALEHHKEAERISSAWGVDPPNPAHATAIAHHREKAVHHVITTAAALSHWHASVLGKHLMSPASAVAAEDAVSLYGGTA